MELKKKSSSDLKPLRGLFLSIGILVSISIVTMAFEYHTELTQVDAEYDEEFWCDFTVLPEYDFVQTDTSYIEQEPIYLIVEKEASFPGGKKAWHLFLKANLKSPTYLTSVKGKIFLSLIIEKDGTISKTEVIRGLHPKLDSAALKSLSLSPDWSPAKQNGKPVKSRKLLMIELPLKQQLD